MGPEASRMAETLGLIDQLTRELRTISHLLHPPLLDEFGLGVRRCAGSSKDFPNAARFR